MRPALRLFASVTRNTSSLYSEPGLPTGLAGLFTHYSPRSTLLYLYSSTLDKLATLPESSVYRQSTEALTRHRMSIVESVQPTGLQEWQQRVAKLVDQHPEAFKKVNTANGSKGEYNIIYNAPEPKSAFRNEDEEINAAYKKKPQLEGPQNQEDVMDRGEALMRDPYAEERKKLRIEAEPSLTMDQVSEIEQKVGAGLIEEIIAVAEGERSLVDQMVEHKV